MATDLEARLRSYGGTLDRHADQAERLRARASGAADDVRRPLVYPIPIDPPSTPRLRLVAAAVLILVAAVAGALVVFGTPESRSDLGTAAQPDGDAPPGREGPHTDPYDPEALFDPGADLFGSHSDMDACMAEAESALEDLHAAPVIPEEPLPEVVYLADRCLLALEGDVLASGEVDGTEWELLTSAEPSGRWVRLRADGLDGVFGMQLFPHDGTGGPLFHQIGVCCRLADADLVLGVVAEQVEAVLVSQDGEPLGGAVTVAAPGYDHVRFAVVPVHTSGVVDVTFALSDGTTVEPVAGGIDLAHRGG